MSFNEPQPERDERLCQHYERLLTCYPWEYRRIYADEMLGVLIAGSHPGQRFPSLADTADVLIAAFWQQALQARRRFTGTRWRDAAALAGLLTAIFALALQACGVLAHLGPHGAAEIGTDQWTVATCSLAVVLAALTLPWWSAAAVAWISVLGQATLMFWLLRATPVQEASALLLSTVSAIALTAPNPARRGAAVLGRWRLVTVTAVGLLAPLAAAPPFQSLAAHTLDLHRGGVPTIVLNPVLACLSGMLVLVLTLPARVRGRVLAILGAPLAMVGVVSLDGAGYLARFQSFLPGLAAGQLLLVLGFPVLTFAIGSALVHRREESRRLRALGMAVDKMDFTTRYTT